jgi:myo-inositol-1-phosphate synthase
VLDLVRLVERAHRAGEYGVLEWLACFFKSPLGVTEQDFGRQVSLLDAWAARRING